MKRFTELYDQLDASTSTAAKLRALEDYFRAAPHADGVWALAILTGRRVKRAVSSTKMRDWAAESAGLPLWIVSESHAAVGDLGETLALILGDGPERNSATLAEIVSHVLIPMSRADDAGRKAMLLATWRTLTQREKFVFHKLISGTFRVGVSRIMAVKALAAAAKADGAPVDAAQMDHRLMGDWPITSEFFASLLKPPTGEAKSASLNPYPFFLAHQVPDELDRLDLIAEQFGDVARWQAEWKWDGLRAQLVLRTSGTALWSRGEELISQSFPELIDAALALPMGTVLDGEVLAFEHGTPLDFSYLQTRITRKQPTGLLFADVPVVFMAYDLLEIDGQDARSRTLAERRERLEQLVASARERLLTTSSLVRATSWDELETLRATSRQRGVEGLMLKRLDSTYGAGRTKLTTLDDKSTAGWWKWKIEPYVIDCVLMAAQRGSGRRASLFTDYTFGVWSGPERGLGELISFAKAYHGKGMTDEVFVQIDRFVRDNTVGRVPGAGIRAVAPGLVFELAFEGLQASPRHRSGIAVRFPRISKWRTDKRPEEADTLATLRAMLDAHGRRTQNGAGGP